MRSTGWWIKTGVVAFVIGAVLLMGASVVVAQSLSAQHKTTVRRKSAVPRRVAQAGAAKRPPMGRMRIGEFTVSYQKGEVDLENINRKQHITIAAPRVVFTSLSYDFAAKRVDAYVDQSGPGGTSRVTRSTATGEVELEIRGDGYTDHLTCDQAFYTANNNPPAVGTIEVKGNVRLVRRDPTYAQPLVNNFEEATITLLGNGNSRIHMHHGTTTGQLIEPEPKPKKPEPTAKQEQ